MVNAHIDVFATAQSGTSRVPSDRETNGEIETLVSVIDAAIEGCGKGKRGARGLAAVAVIALLGVPSVTAAGPDDAAAKELDDWHTFTAQHALPKPGCYQAAFPNREWTEVPCIPMPGFMEMAIPKRDVPLYNAGNGNDIYATSPAGFITTATGKFENVNVTSENGLTSGGTLIPNLFILQLNTNYFQTPACNGHTGCGGWEQFLWGNNGSNGGGVGIQYWLLSYGPNCPSPWSQAGSSCYQNGPAVSVPAQVATNLGNMSLSGVVTANADSATAFVGGTAYASAGTNAVNASTGWKSVEFNVFGPGGGGQAQFNSGASLTPRINLSYGGDLRPICNVGGFTGETNNLNFGSPPPAGSAPAPSILFNESTSGTATASCNYATSVGDTHLTTDQGLLYDFQASGDYLLAQTPTFSVQARQLSGAPNWPNAALNKAIATQMGKTKVEVCLDPERLVVNGKETPLTEGVPVGNADDVFVIRTGHVYYIRSADGDSIRVTVNSGWMNALVGFGRWPVQVTGLLANADSNVDTIAARNGSTFTAPFAFDDLYGKYGTSWQVKPSDSLMPDCGSPPPSSGPEGPFDTSDLDTNTRDGARATCVSAGVQGSALLEACTLDVAVLGSSAAQVYGNVSPPVVDGNPIQTPGGSGHRRCWLLVVVLALVVMVAFVLFWRRRKTP